MGTIKMHHQKSNEKSFDHQKKKKIIKKNAQTFSQRETEGGNTLCNIIQTHTHTEEDNRGCSIDIKTSATPLTSSASTAITITSTASS